MNTLIHSYVRNGWDRNEKWTCEFKWLKYKLLRIIKMIMG